MLKKQTILSVLTCFSLFLSLFANSGLAFADGSTTITILGSSKVAVLEQDNAKGHLKVKVTDANITSFQGAELMVVNDCSFYFAALKLTRPSQTSNEFEINELKNGTYAFYIISNGKVVAYLRFKVTGASRNAVDGMTGITELREGLAEFYGLDKVPPKGSSIDMDADSEFNGVCVNKNIQEKPDAKPDGSGDIEQTPDDKGNNNNNNDTDWLKQIMDKLDGLGGKIDKLGDKIPPPPDWNKLADKFANEISPKLADDIKSMTGEAPDPPPPPPQIPETDNKGLDKYEPDFQNPVNNGFTADDIKNSAPVIKENKDESGGFDIKDPIGSLPDVPKNLPKPGETEKSEWGKNKPKTQEPDPIPAPKEPSKEIDTSGFPKPKPPSGDSSPPKPSGGGGGGEGSLPKPGGGGGGDGSPPKPSGGGGGGGWTPSTGNYKRHPDDPDGSG